MHQGEWDIIPSIRRRYIAIDLHCIGVVHKLAPSKPLQHLEDHQQHQNQCLEVDYPYKQSQQLHEIYPVILHEISQTNL